MRTYDSKTKTFNDLKAVGKYHKISNETIKLLPLSTHHRIKQKIYGDVFYLSKNNDSHFIINNSGNSNHKSSSELKTMLNIKYLIDKFCKNNNTAIEIIYSKNKYWLTNIFTDTNVCD